MNRQSAWVECFFDCQFPLLKQDIKAEKAEQILQNHKPSKLYKYRQADDFGFDVIEKAELWLARADTVNDPFDCFFTYNVEDILDSHERGLREKKPDVSDEVVQQLRQQHSGTIKNDHDKIREDFRKRVKLCSLSQRSDIKKMWEEYSDNHSGFCIEFDFQQVQQDLWKILLPVFYTDTRVDFSSYITRIHREREKVNPSFIRRAALTKSLEWEYEEEWRIILPDDPEKSGIVCSSLPMSCVYLGCNATQETESRVESICSQKNMPVKKIRRFA